MSSGFEFSAKPVHGAFMQGGKLTFTATKAVVKGKEPPLLFGPLPKGALLWVGPTKERGGAIFPKDADACTPITRSNAIALKHRYLGELQREECSDGELFSVK